MISLNYDVLNLIFIANGNQCAMDIEWSKDNY